MPATPTGGQRADLPWWRRALLLADALMQGGMEDGDSPLLGRRVLINPTEMVPNPSNSLDETAAGSFDHDFYAGWRFKRIL